MKIKAKKLAIPLIGLLLILGMLMVLLPQSINAVTVRDGYEHGLEYDYIRCEYEYETTHSHYDILDGSYGQGCSKYYLPNGNMQPMNASVSNLNTCNSIHPTSTSAAYHGPGNPSRQNGYHSNFLNAGCGSYCGYNYTYGSTDIPFFLDTTGMTNTRRDDIRAQIAMWNETVMYDGTGQIVNIYEVNHTNNINGFPVVVVKQEDPGGNLVGEFDYSNTATPLIKINATMNVDTPAHEFGHVLGLEDTDWRLNEIDGGDHDGTHKTLMGYSRGTTTGTLNSAIKYQDIQGIAVINNRHTVHYFNRYVLNGSDYVHFCFYCDIVDVQSSAKSGSAAMATASSCTHDYQPMVSHGNRHWYKCTKCYAVNETANAPFVVSSGTITGLNFTPSAALPVFIPSSVGGQAITATGTVFA